LLGRPDWALDPALSDALERSRQGHAINAHIRAWAKVRRVADIVAQGQAAGVPLAKYATPMDVLHDAHERERGLFAPVAIAKDVVLDMLVAPFQFGADPLRLRGGPPVLGEYARTKEEA
jgi:crotonobetainyl-CoA:carnitine CoA-transferase CaiB-like acyl-CoA transferase